MMEQLNVHERKRQRERKAEEKQDKDNNFINLYQIIYLMILNYEIPIKIQEKTLMALG